MKLSGITLAAALLTTGTAQAQVTLYQHCNYGGYAVTVPAGDHLMGTLQARGMRNDDISAIKVAPGWQVTIYQHQGFQGRSRTLTADDGCLVASNFNDMISSVRVKQTGGGGSVNGRTVGIVKHSGGSFEQQGGQWLEKDVYGRVTFRFDEMHRDEWSVYLNDRSRNVQLQLDLHRKQVLYGTNGGPKQPLYQITSSSAAQGGWTPAPKPPRPVVNGYSTRDVRHSGGSFVQQGGQWYEKDSYGRVTFRFDEVQRDEWSVYLHDRSRNVQLQLDLHRKQVLYGTNGGAKRPLYRISAAY